MRWENARDLQAVFLRELVVTLVVGRYAHHRACPVPEKRVVGDPDRNVLTRKQVPAESAGEDAGLFALYAQPLDICLLTRPHDISIELCFSVRCADLRH